MLPAQTPIDSPAATPVPALPSLPEGIDRETADLVIAEYLAGQDSTIAEIGERVAHADVARRGEPTEPLPVRLIGQILDSPYAVELISLIRRLAEQRAAVLAAEVKTEAIHITRRIASTSSRDDVALRAATALLRLSTVPRVATPAAPRTTAESSPGTAPRRRRIANVLLKQPRARLERAAAHPAAPARAPAPASPSTSKSPLSAASDPHGVRAPTDLEKRAREALAGLIDRMSRSAEPPAGAAITPAPGHAAPPGPASRDSPPDPHRNGRHAA